MKLAICIPIHNEAAAIIPLLQMVDEVRSKLTVESQVLLYLDGCTDRTRELAEKYLASGNGFVLFEQAERRGKLFALNFLAEAVRRDETIGRVLLLDSDVSFGADLAKLLETPVSQTPSVAAPRIEPLVSSCSSLLERWAQLCFSVYDHIRRLDSAERSLWCISGNCLVLDRSALLSVYPIQDGSLINDDFYLGWQLRQLHIAIEYDPSIVVRTPIARSVPDFVRQKLRIRAGFAQLDKLGIPVWQLRTRCLREALGGILRRREYLLFFPLLLDLAVTRIAVLIPQRNSGAVWERISPLTRGN